MESNRGKKCDKPVGKRKQEMVELLQKVYECVLCRKRTHKREAEEIAV